jgi:hypothetical protein
LASGRVVAAEAEQIAVVHVPPAAPCSRVATAAVWLDGTTTPE